MSHVQIKIIECGMILLTINFIYMFHFHFPKLHSKIKYNFNSYKIMIKSYIWKKKMLYSQKNMFKLKEAGFKKLFKNKKHKKNDDFFTDIDDIDDFDDDIFK